MEAKIIDKKVVLKDCTLICGDTGAEEIVFLCPQVVDNINLKDIPVYIKVENSFGNVYKGLLKSEVYNDQLKIVWKITKEVTQISGNVKCQLCFEREDGTLVMNTLIFELEIKSSVAESSNKIILEVNHITQLQNQLQKEINELKSYMNQEGLVKKGDNVSIFENDAGYLTEQTGSSLFISQLDVVDMAKNILFHDVDSFLFYTTSKEDKYERGNFITLINNSLPVLIVVDKTPVYTEYPYHTAEEILSDFRRRKTIKIGYYKIAPAGYSSFELPKITSADVGKTLKVDGNGKWVLA